MAKAPSKPTTTIKPKTKAAPKAAKAVAQPAKKAVRKTASKAASVKAKAPVKAKTTKKAKTPVKAKTAAKTTKAAPKTKAAVKAPSKTRAAAKTSSLAKTSMSASSLQTKVDTIAKRLSAAESQTKKNVATLETDFTALASQMSRTKAGQTRLTRRVTELSKTLTQDMESVQSDIRRELASVLQNPTIDQLQNALIRAEERLQESETAQNTAIARINHHIADLATVIEGRLSDEANARITAMADMKREMSNGQDRLLAAQAELKKSQAESAQANQLRFANLQSESAGAIHSLGDKLVDVAEEMGRRRDAMASTLRQELSESTLSASAEFEQFRRVVEHRLEALETEVASLDSQIERAVAPIASRLEGLEYGLAQAPQPAQNAYAPALQSAPPMTSPLAAPVNQPEGNAQPLNYEEDAFSPAPAPAAHAVAAPAAAQTLAAPVPAPMQEAPLELNEAAPALAVPYDASAYQDAQYSAQQTHAQAQPYGETYAQGVGENPYGQPATTQTQAAPQAFDAPPAYAPTQDFDAPPAYAQTQPPFPNVEELPTTDADLPYADPAYAEGQFGNPAIDDDSMSAARPGAFDNLKKIGRKASGATGEPSALSALLTPRNLRLGGLVAALGVASFIGVQTLKGDSAPIGNSEFSVASNATLDESRPSLGEILPASEGRAPAAMMTADGTPIGPQIDQDTIGQYADNRKMALAAGSEDALGTAAAAGNPIAQLQLGLSKIENGDLGAGAELIRAAANQEQPAALYRLAKLYETGQGVGKDAATARQLTERAARGGNRIAMHDLALYFAEGRGGVEIDMPTAAKWFEKAAQRGVVDSQFNLGVLFESGQGLPQDVESALMWYSIAGTQGDQMAAGRVGVLRQTLGEDQIARADKRIAAFTPSRIDEEANGIFNNVPWARPAQVASRSADKENVVQTQTLLNELGYAVGEADGAIGPKTKNAILNFQRNNNMAETGTVSAELIDRLSSAVGA